MQISQFIRGVQEEEAAEELDAKVENEGEDENKKENLKAERKNVKNNILDSLQLGAYSIKGNRSFNAYSVLI